MKNITQYLSVQNTKKLLRFITCGSVDDGKSTLIGRLLYDTKAVYDDQIQTIQQKDTLDLALLVDGLQSEIEQGITIDVAYRYFNTDKRKFIIADTPGHEQYTRNMATAASNAELAIILIDARKKILPQTKRHTFIAHLLGIKNIIVAVNKIDLVDYSQNIFREIETEYKQFISTLTNNINVEFIPISALNGDNIVEKSSNTNWYSGKSLIELLEDIDVELSEEKEDFLFSVQYVNRPNHTFRGYCGSVVSGSVNVGDEIKILPSNKTTKIKEIFLYKKSFTTAHKGQSITITLENEIDISRGDMIIDAKNSLEYGQNYSVDIVWLGDKASKNNENYIFKFGTKTVYGHIESINHKVNIQTLEKIDDDKLELNDLGNIAIELTTKIPFVSYDVNKNLGGGIMINPLTNQTVAAVMIVKENQKQTNISDKKSYASFELQLHKLISEHYPEWFNITSLKG